MILSGIASALLNTKSSFYYCGVEISKDNFDITEFSKICNTINELKNQMSSENAKALSFVKSRTEIIGSSPITKECNAIVSVFKDRVFVGIYNKESKTIEPLTKDILTFFTEDLFVSISFRMNVVAARYSKGIILTGNGLTNPLEKIIFENYKHHVEKFSNCFYHTYELEFINGYKDYILTDEQLKKSLEER